MSDIRAGLARQLVGAQFPKSAITADLARRLIAAQFPEWSHLPVRQVGLNGWDNTTFRLGDTMSVRLPTGDWYSKQVEKEHRWLPVLAPQLPLPIPVPLAQGEPACGYPWPWSVYQWIDGEPLMASPVPDLVQLAADLADFLAALYTIRSAGGPGPGEHNFYRGGSLTVYDADTRAALGALAGHIDTVAAADVWATALRATWHGTPVWFHGDIAPGNLLVNRGRLSAVIDFGTSGVGDPSCDTVIAWTVLSGESRRIFMRRLPVDDATWARGRGWAIWKAMIVLVRALKSDPDDADECKRVISEIIADHAARQPSELG
jgi:aminoglycoside phosphotransferase (APT) family kinase protein